MLKNISKIFLTTILGKLFGFLKIVVLIQLYGTNVLTDALIIAISIYWFWSNIVVYSLFSASLVPKLANKKSQKSQLLATLRTLYSVNLVSIIGLVLVLVFHEQIILVFSPVDNDQYLLYAETLLLVMSPLLFLIPTTEIFTILNQFNNRMVTASINLTVWNILQLLGIVLAFGLFNDQIYLLYVYGVLTIVGYFITSTVQLVGARYFDYYDLRQLVKISYGYTLRLIRNNYKYFVSVLLTQLNVYIDNYFISSLDTGSISRYNIIIKIPELLQSLTISALAVVFFNKIVLEKDKIPYYFKKFSCYLVPLLVLAIAFIHYYGTEFIYLIYGEKSFASLDSGYIRVLLSIITINAFFMVMTALLVKAFIARNRTSILLFASAVNVVCNIIMNSYLIEDYGLQGIAIATLISTYILFAILVSSVFEFSKFKNLILVLLFFIVLLSFFR
jgi:putative peptidoglycan lipid II flippase